MPVRFYICTDDVIIQNGNAKEITDDTSKSWEIQHGLRTTHRKLMRYNMGSGWQNL